MKSACFPSSVPKPRDRSGLCGLIAQAPLLVALCVLLLAVSPTSGASASSNVLPPSVRVTLAKAGALMNEERYLEAVDILSSFVQRAHDDGTDAVGPPASHGEVYYLLGTCQLLTDRYHPAKQALETAVRLQPAHVSAWINLGKADYELEEYGSAAAAFDHAFTNSTEPKPDHLYYSAVAFLLANEHARAIEQFERLMAAFPDSMKPDWHEHYVHALLGVEQYRKALPHIRHLSQHFTGDKQRQWQEMLLHLYLQLKLVQEAEDYARSLTESAPDQVKWWKALASLHLQQGDYHQALATLLIANFLEPLNAQETKLVADLFLQLGVPGQAAPLYRKLLKVDKESDMLINLLITLRQLDQNQQALEALEAFAPQTKDPQLLMQRAELLFSLERYEDAIEAYEQLATLDAKKEKQARQMIAYATAQSGRQRKAGSENREAASSGPGT